MPLHVSSTCAHHQEVKIALHSLWYHHTYIYIYIYIYTEMHGQQNVKICTNQYYKSVVYLILSVIIIVA